MLKVQLYFGGDNRYTTAPGYIDFPVYFNQYIVWTFSRAINCHGFVIGCFVWNPWIIKQLLLFKFTHHVATVTHGIFPSPNIQIDKCFHCCNGLPLTVWTNFQCWQSDIWCNCVANVRHSYPAPPPPPPLRGRRDRMRVPKISGKGVLFVRQSPAREL